MQEKKEREKASRRAVVLSRSEGGGKGRGGRRPRLPAVPDDRERKCPRKKSAKGEGNWNLPKKKKNALRRPQPSISSPKEKKEKRTSLPSVLSVSRAPAERGSLCKKKKGEEARAVAVSFGFWAKKKKEHSRSSSTSSIWRQSCGKAHALIFAGGEREGEKKPRAVASVHDLRGRERKKD